MTQEYNKTGNVCIDVTLKRVRITTVAMEKLWHIMHNMSMPYKNIN